MKFAARSCWGLLSVAFVIGAPSCMKRGSAPVDAGSSENGGPSSTPSAENDLLQASTFDDGKSAPWTTSFSAPAEGAAGVENGAVSVEAKNVSANVRDGAVPSPRDGDSEGACPLAELQGLRERHGEVAGGLLRRMQSSRWQRRCRSKVSLENQCVTVISTTTTKNT